MSAAAAAYSSHYWPSARVALPAHVHPRRVQLCRQNVERCARQQNVDYVSHILYHEVRRCSTLEVFAKNHRKSSIARLVLTHAPVCDVECKKLVRFREESRPAESELRALLDTELPRPSWPADVVRGVCETGALNPITL